MLLAIDTATRWMGLALHDGRKIVNEVGWETFQTQTMELAPTIVRMLDRAQTLPAALQGIAVAIGPGSYTGLRIGLGVAKGMALANNTPLIGIPTLDILALGVPRQEGVLIVIAEAGRTRVCAGTYHWQDSRGWQALSQPIIESWDVLLSTVTEPAVFAGEVSVEAAKAIRLSPRKLRLFNPAGSVRRAGYLAELGWRRLRRGQIDDASTLAPIYLKDASGASKSVMS